MCGPDNMPEIFRRETFINQKGESEFLDAWAVSDNWFRTIVYSPGMSEVPSSVVVTTNEKVSIKYGAGVAYALIRSLWPF